MKRWVTAALLSGALAVTACEAEPAEPAEPSSSTPSSSEPTSAAPTTEPTGPVEPKLPPEAEESTKAGAEAFVEYWWEIVNYAQATGDTKTLKRTSVESCQTCHSGIDWIDQVYAAGGRVVGEGYEILDQNAIAAPGGSWAIVARIRVGDQAAKGAGELNERFPGGVRRHVLSVNLNPNGWQVISWEIK